LITMDDILNAEGKTIEGPDHAVLKVLEVKRGKAGLIQLRLMVDTPSSDSDDTIAWAAGMRFRRGMWIRQGSEEENNEVARELTLLDAKGSSFKLTDSIVKPQDNGYSQEYDVTFKPQSGLALPSRLIYTGQRKLFMKVAFTLQNVPLP